MRLAIIGSGSLGSLFAAFLSPYVDLVLVGHWPAQMTLLRETGLILIHMDGHQTHHVFPVSNDPASVPPVDIALVLVKCYQTKLAAQATNTLLSSKGLAITLQNGLGNLEKLVQLLGSDRATQGVTSLGAYMVEPGIVRHAGKGQIYLPALKDNSFHAPGLIQDLAILMNAAGLETAVAADVDGLIWGKLVVNAGINPLTALLRVPNGFLAANEIARKIMVDAAQEAAEVALALGINLPFADPASRVIEVAQQTAANNSSMLQDVRRNAPTEIDAICGEIARHGQRIGIPTPINEELYRLLNQDSALNKSGIQTSRIVSLNTLFAKRDFSSAVVPE